MISFACNRLYPLVNEYFLDMKPLNLEKPLNRLDRGEWAGMQFEKMEFKDVYLAIPVELFAVRTASGAATAIL